jgi:hypothetical protein
MSPLEVNQLRDFKELVLQEAQNIIKNWNEYFKSDKHIEPKTISRRIK